MSMPFFDGKPLSKKTATCGIPGAVFFIVPANAERGIPAPASETPPAVRINCRRFMDGTYSAFIMISSAKSHAFSPAPGCHEGQNPMFFATIRTYRACVPGGSGAVKSRIVTAVSCGETEFVRCTVSRKDSPSEENENSTAPGKKIHELISCRQPNAIFFNS